MDTPPTCCDLPPSPPVEDALRAFVTVTEPVSTSVLDRLLAHGLVERTPDEWMALTRHGTTHARHLVRRYRLVELFLVQVLHLDRDEAVREADVLEHAVSARLVDRIDALLGRPERDLRGSPIPRILAPAMT
jgi:DtxR family transcriptional regulator, Mn-dependent transcriptional regulator